MPSSRPLPTRSLRVSRYLERRGLVERDVETTYLSLDGVDEDPMHQPLGDSITYRISMGPQRGRKVFTLQTLPSCEPEDRLSGTLGQVAGFSLHAGVATNGHECRKLERLCRYMACPPVSEHRLSLTPSGVVCGCDDPSDSNQMSIGAGTHASAILGPINRFR